MKSDFSFWQFLTAEDGQSMVEYGLIIALLALVALIGFALMSDGTRGLYLSNMEQIINAMEHTENP